MTKKITAAILSTGDEITNGDVTDTNGPHIAQALAQIGITVNEHATASDNPEILKNVLEGLYKRNNIIFTIGGLGPTTDDITRNSISEVTQRPLTFHQETWQAICDRFSQYKIDIAQNNKQQAYFPEGSHILKNHRGTAAGCALITKSHHIFMLPGPPHECRPMFHEQVTPWLSDYQKKSHKLCWLTLGLGESILADKIKNIELQYKNIAFHYCYQSPYVKLTCVSEDELLLKQAGELINHAIPAENMINHTGQWASVALIKQLSSQKRVWTICDKATRGIWPSRLLTPDNHTYIQQTNNPDKADFISTGLDEYWSGNTTGTTNLSLTRREKKHSVAIRIRGKHTIDQSIEWLCHTMLLNS